MTADAGLDGEGTDPVACAQRFYGAAIATAHKGIDCTHVHSIQSSAGIAVPSLFSTICRLIDRGSYVVGEHASERLLERGIMEWQVIAGMPDAKLLAERRNARPNPAVEVRLLLPDGRDCTAIWSHLRQAGVAKLVTVYLLNDNDPSEEG
jgi:hypothetical protein